MDLITVRDLFKNTEKYAGAEVNVGGWVRNRRGSKQFGFIVLNDGTYFTPVQVVYNDTLENFQEISKINIGAALIIRGTLVLTPDSKQPFEIQAESITVEGSSTGDYPLQPKRHSMEFLRTINPVFQPDGYACSMAELRPEEKNAISHRGNALIILKEELRNYYADK